MKEYSETTLDSVVYQFFQDTNCVDGNSEEVETLNVTCSSVLGLDEENKFFINFKTGEYGWTVNNPKEFYDFLCGIADSINFSIKKMVINKKNEHEQISLFSKNWGQ